MGAAADEGIAQTACVGLEYTEPYPDVKEAILRRFGVYPEGSQRKFHSLVWSKELEPEEYAVRKEKLADRWLTPEEGTGHMKAKIVVEDMLNNLPWEMKVWMMERQPMTSVEVA